MIRLALQIWLAPQILFGLYLCLSLLLANSGEASS